MDIGIKQSSGIPVQSPLPISWLGRADMPLATPTWANIFRLNITQQRNLVAQIGYDKSQWDYTKIGTNNRLGRYQVSTSTLENYGLLTSGANAKFGSDCVNVAACWQPYNLRLNNSFSNYNHNVTSLYGFLTNIAAQDHLAYQILYDMYNTLIADNTIKTTDTADIVAGMMYVGWDLGTGERPTQGTPAGTGAIAWRSAGVGTGSTAFNSGRYAIAVLS